VRGAADPVIAALVAAFAAVGAVASVVRYDHLASGLDLGIFDQAIWHYSRFEAPFSSITGENVLGDHLHPLIATLAPLYWVWSDPRVLLIAQSALVAASIVPVFLFARDRLGRTGARLLAVGYAAFWGLQVGVLYDFHELAFAPVLIASAVLCADRRRWGAFWVAIALLLAVKEDMAILVVFVGAFLLAAGERRRGAVALIAGAAWYELATQVVIAHFAPSGRYGHWAYTELGGGPLSALWALVQEPWRLLTIGLSPSVKARTLAALFAPFLLLSLPSRLVLLAVPLLAERFLATNPNYWVAHFQYSLAIAPVLAMAAADGLRTLARLLPENRRPPAIVVACAVIAVANVALTRLASPDAALTTVTSAGELTTPAGAAAGLRMLARVPPGSSVAATDQLLAHLSERSDLVRITPAGFGGARYLVLDVADVGCCEETSTDGADGAAIDAVLPSLTPVYYDAGWLLARRPPTGLQAGSGAIPPLAADRARSIDGALLRWRAPVLGAIAPSDPCYAALRARAAGTSACFATLRAGLKHAQRALLDALQPSTGLAGPCGGLARMAARDSEAVAGALEDVTRAGAAGHDRAVVAAYLAFKAREASADRLGAIVRFAILCTPRAR
jgi:uncharacterized membrane protein